MICCPVLLFREAASAAIAGVPYRPRVQLKRPAFSFCVRQSRTGFSARPVRMIRAGSMPSSACMSLSEITADLVVDLVDQAAHVGRREEVELRVARQLVELAREVVGGVVIGEVAADHVAAGSHTARWSAA